MSIICVSGSKTLTINCDRGWPQGRYGGSCLNDCHCLSGNCDPSNGVCRDALPEGTCSRVKKASKFQSFFLENSKNVLNLTTFSYMFQFSRTLL